MHVEKFQERNFLEIPKIRRQESHRVWMREGIGVLLMAPLIAKLNGQGRFDFPPGHVGEGLPISELLFRPWDTIWEQFEGPGPLLDITVPDCGCLGRKRSNLD